MITMYAIVEIAGQQFKVEEGKSIFVHRLEAETDKVIEFDRVLLIEDNERVIVGEPVIKDAVIEGRVIDHVRGDKVIVFKKKRKKGYRVRNGHRQNFTRIEIVSINEHGVQKKAAPAKAVKTIPAETEVTAESPAVVKPEPAASPAEKPARKSVKKEAAAEKPATKTTEKKSAEKKPAVKKTEEKKVTEKKPSARKPAGEKKQ